MLLRFVRTVGLSGKILHVPLVLLLGGRIQAIPRLWMPLRCLLGAHAGARRWLRLRRVRTCRSRLPRCLVHVLRVRPYGSRRIVQLRRVRRHRV